MIENNNTFCVLPWLHLASHPHGGTTLCCNANHNKGISRARNFTASTDSDITSTVGDQFLDLQNNTIEELMNSDSFKQVRLEMLAGKKPYACLRCYKEESHGIASKRVRENKEYPYFTIDSAKQITDNDGTISKIDLEFVELRLGNICNVKCRTCNPWSSSKWISDYNKLTDEFSDMGKFDKTQNQFDWPENELFWDQLFEYTTNAKVFYINGGEPTLIKHHFTFLERLIAAKKTDIKLWYNINMTNMSEDIISIWRQFDNVEIGFSIDDINERNTYIRNPTKWETVLESIEMLLPHADKLKLSITQTVSWMNYYYLGEFHLWAEKLGLYVHHNFVNDPTYFSPNVLPLEMRKDINARLANILPHDKLNALKQFEEKPTNTALINTAMSYTNSLDKLRDESFDSVFPELKLLRDY